MRKSLLFALALTAVFFLGASNVIAGIGPIGCIEAAECDDGNECTEDVCVQVNGEITVLNGGGYCENPPKQDGEPCTDTGLDCWDAGCEAGLCVQETYPVSGGTPCDDVPDTEACANPACDGGGTCDPTYAMEPDGTPCGDTGLDCWDAGCEAGLCVQETYPVSGGTPCDDVPDTEECANPACDGGGTCDPTYAMEPDGTPCGDTGLDCWDAGCEAGLCVQETYPVAGGTPCDDVPDTEECANPACDGGGTCDPTYAMEPDGTPCGDTGLDCWDAGCEAGLCVQETYPVAGGTPCDDIPDTEECANPACDGGGTCDPTYAMEPAGTACGDSSATDCDNPDTCDGLGECGYNNEPAGSPCDDGLFCNSFDTCDGIGICLPGTPVNCDDGVGCTDDICNETTDSCDNTPNDTNCPNDTIFCNGTEFCDPVADCSSSGDPCPVGETCDEDADLCAAACEDPSPLTQGYWHRQCLGLPGDEGGIDPGRNGRGPKKNQESGFAELMPCAEDWLFELGFFEEATCTGLDADPPSDSCERAIRQLTALLLNICSENLSVGCELDLSCSSCSALSVGGLLYEISSLIISGDPHECKLASECAALVNEGEGLSIPGVQLNEIRIDQPSTDIDEYFELQGPIGTSLVGLTYLVIGDPGSGTIEAVVDLSGYSIPLSGFFVAAENTFTLGVTELTTDLNFENSDNVTHMLVSNFSGSAGDDLDTNDDGVLDVMPWDEIVDCVALIETTGSGEEVYCSTTVGPDGPYVPGHVYRCPSGWVIGLFDPVGGDDTPGAANTCDNFEACCNPDGTCADITPDVCSAQGGSTQGSGTECSAIMCPTLNPEACCYPGGTCADISPGICSGQGGAPQGLATTCPGVVCPL